MTLTVVIADSYPTYFSLTNEDEWRPYGRRTVQIELTPDQSAMLSLRKTGEWGCGNPINEHIERMWIEPEEKP